jgi:methyl-accepting chemotaxis protein
MFKNLKLGAKIGLGFGILILIAVFLGSMAVVNMSNVKKESTKLAHEYVPEVNIAGALNRQSYRTMYAMRGYAYTAEKRFLDQGTAAIAQVNDSIKEAEELAKKAKNLVKLAGEIEEIKKAANEYARLMDETVALNAKLDEYRRELDTNGTNWYHRLQNRPGS